MPSTSPETERALARYASPPRPPPNTSASSSTSSDNYALLVERARSWHLTKLQSPPPLRTPYHRLEGMDADVGYDADSESEEWEQSDIEEYDADSAEVGCAGAVFVRGDTGSGEDGGRPVMEKLAL